MGDEATAKIYQVLLERTMAITEPLQCKKYVYYSDSIAETDLWDTDKFDKRLQIDGDLGQKMKAAFKEVKDAGAKKIIIIGSDCYDLTTKIIENSFSSLTFNDAVIGPAEDGGYYLLGLKELIDSIFDLDEWSTSTLSNSTFYLLKEAFKEVVMLPTLNDVDEEKDVSFSY
jgi:rSAM/selenodomain-associated transferase 1